MNVRALIMARCLHAKNAISATERSFVYFLYLRAVRDDPEASAGNKRVSSYSVVLVFDWLISLANLDLELSAQAADGVMQYCCKTMPFEVGEVREVTSSRRFQ